MPPPAQLPVIVLTGFLGSGKTTLLNKLLRQWPDSAVLINEFGATPLDQHLLEPRNIPVAVLAGGCLCCELREALAPALQKLWRAWQPQQPFARLIIEASGVASPQPILDVLLRDPWLSTRLSLQAVVTTVSVANAHLSLARFPQAMAQVSAADVLLLTQADLADAPRLHALHRDLARLAPDTPRFNVHAGQIDAAALLDAAQRTRPRPTADAADHGFHSLSLHIPASLPWARLQSMLHTLWHRHADQWVRIKGVVHLADTAMALQMTDGYLHPPQPLAHPAACDGIGTLVLISDGVIDGLPQDIMALLRGDPGLSQPAY